MLYLLTRIDDTGYDEFVAKVIRADKESQARTIANMETADEGRIWTDPEKVMCETITPGGDPCVILESFNAG